MTCNIKVDKFGMMAKSTKDSGKMASNTDMEFLNGLMAMCIRESGRMMSRMGMECSHGQMALSMRDPT